jgi:aspartate/methionine/tyrosine aminotransferase
VPADETTDFLPDYDALRRAITPRTKAIVLNTPCNPTGAVYGRKPLKEIASLALTHDLWIVADEIYEHLVYDGHTHESIGALGKEVFQRTITVNGVSKSFAMTGWRIGYSGRADGGRPRREPSTRPDDLQRLHDCAVRRVGCPARGHTRLAHAAAGDL